MALFAGIVFVIMLVNYHVSLLNFILLMVIIFLACLLWEMAGEDGK
jgi:hypothetical protein